MASALYLSVTSNGLNVEPDDTELLFFPKAIAHILCAAALMMTADRTGRVEIPIPTSHIPLFRMHRGYIYMWHALESRILDVRVAE